MCLAFSLVLAFLLFLGSLSIYEFNSFFILTFSIYLEVFCIVFAQVNFKIVKIVRGCTDGSSTDLEFQP